MRINKISRFKIFAENSCYCIMLVSLQPRYITHYRSSIGLIFIPHGKLMDRSPPQTSPSLHCDAQCGVATACTVGCNVLTRWKLFHFTTAPSKDSPPRGWIVEGRCTLSSFSLKRYFVLHFPRTANTDAPYDRCLRAVAAVVRIRASFTTARIRDTDEWFIEEHRARETTIVSQSYVEILGKSEEFNMNLFDGKSIFHKMQYSVTYMYSQLFVNSCDVSLKKNSIDIPYL